MRLLHPDMRVSFALRSLRAAKRDMDRVKEMYYHEDRRQACSLYRSVKIRIQRGIDVANTVMEEHDRLPDDLMPLAMAYFDYIDAMDLMRGLCKEN